MTPSFPPWLPSGWLAGQGWWDLTQYRVNPADGGVPMHWSRIVDAPIAGGILLLRPLFGQPLAEQMVMAIWPPLHLGALLIAVALGYRHLPDRRIAFRSEEHTSELQSLMRIS